MALALMAFPNLNAQTDTLNCQRDAWIWSMQQARSLNFGVANSSNGGLNNVLRAECWQWRSGVDDTIRFLLSFDLSAYTKADVSKAYLDLKHFSNPNFTKQVGNNAFEVYRIDDWWQESLVTWQNQPYYDSTLLVRGAASVSDSQDYFLDITPLVHQSIDLGGEGFLIKLKEETAFKGLSFASREHQHTTLRPRLLIQHQKMSTQESTPLSASLSVNTSFKNHLQINGVEAKAEAVVYDFQGKLFHRSAVGDGKINTEQWPSGYYLIEIEGVRVKLLKN